MWKNFRHIISSLQSAVSDTIAATELTLQVSHTASVLLWCPQPELCSGVLLKPFSLNHLMKMNTSVKTSCTSLRLRTLPLLFSLAFSVRPSHLLSCSLSWCVGFIHWWGCVAWWQHRSMCVCVCGCVSVSMCMCRMKCRLSLSLMRHTRRHTCTRRGGGCCVRTEGAVGVLSELDLGFFSFTLHRVGVIA